MASERLRQDSLRRIGILHEDDDLVVVHKPAGLAVHGGADTKGRDLLAVLTQAYGPRPPDLHLAHRLDRGTSGLLVVLKSPDLVATTQALWPSAEKRYLAIAVGRVEDARRIETPLLAKDGRPQKARSDLKPVTVLEGRSLVQVAITTGRQHQIRRHLAEIGHPVLMDDKYGDFAVNKDWVRFGRERGLSRPKHLFLHAAELRFAHPRTGNPHVFESPMPDEWEPWLRDD